MRSAAIVVFCVLLSTTAVQAKKGPPKSPLVDEKCGDLSDGASVRIYVSPVTDIPKMGGMSFNKCDALEWFMSFVNSAVNKNKKGRKKASRPDDRVDCSNPDVTEAWISNTIPSSSKTCDITKTYLDLFFEGKLSKRFVWLPPPMWCSINGGGRRLMQVVNVVGFDGEGSASISASSGNTGAAASVDAGEGSQVQLDVVTSEGPRSSRAVSIARVTAAPSRKVVALTVCKGTCCFSLAVSGEMYGRLKDIVSETSCPLFKMRGRTGGRRGTIIRSSSSASASSSAGGIP